MSEGKALAGAGLGRFLGQSEDKSVVLMDKQVVFYPKDSESDSIKARVEIEKRYNGAVLKAGLAFKGDSLLRTLFHEFVGEFSIKVEREEEIEEAYTTLNEFFEFVSEFTLATKKALGMYPEMAKKEEPKKNIDDFKDLLTKTALIPGKAIMMNPVLEIMSKVNEVEQETGFKATTLHIPREIENLLPTDPRFTREVFGDVTASNKLFGFDVEWNAEELTVDVGTEPIVRTKVSEEEKLTAEEK